MSFLVIGLVQYVFVVQNLINNEKSSLILLFYDSLSQL